ncbi:hypothetical protein KQH62_05580 [bacterium]|nr:hypothetical protein [bacterium]
MSNIEIRGVSFLEAFLAFSNILKPHLKKNDKTMSWDGNIFVYNQEVKKDSFFGQVPVQVKSTVVDEFSLKKTSFDFEKDDLNNYFLDGGILLFVVEINKKNEFEFYISSLMPSDLKVILDDIEKKDSNTKNIKLEHLPKDNTQKIESICNNFVINRNRQMSIKNLPSIPVNDAKELIITAVSDGRSLDEYLLNVPQYVYGKVDDSGRELFIDKINFTKVEKNVDKPIAIGEKIYFPNFHIIKDRKSKLISFGNKVTYNLSSGKITFHFSGNLSEQLITNEFLVEMIKSEHFFIDELEIVQQGRRDHTGLLQHLITRHSRLKDTKALLNIFSIDPCDFDLGTLSPAHNQVLGIFVDCMVYGKTRKNIPFTDGLQAIKIGNLVLGVIIYKEGDLYKIINAFDENIPFRFYIGNEKPEVPSSPYIGLSTELLVNMDNLDIEILARNVTQVVYSDLYAQNLNLLVLELINAYDETEDKKFITTAQKIIDWLISHDSKNKTYIINKYQIICRLRELTDTEIEALTKLKDDSTDELLCGISILLENKSDFRVYFNRLSEEGKRFFMGFPIYTLAEKLNLIEPMI